METAAAASSNGETQRGKRAHRGKRQTTFLCKCALKKKKNLGCYQKVLLHCGWVFTCQLRQSRQFFMWLSTLVILTGGKLTLKPTITPEKGEPQWKTCLHQTGNDCVGFSWLLIGVGGLNPLGAAPSLGRCVRKLAEQAWEWARRQCSSSSRFMLLFEPWLPSITNCDQKVQDETSTCPPSCLWSQECKLYQSPCTGTMLMSVSF